MTISCPNCQSQTIKKNGQTHTNIQNYKCLNFGRQFVENNEQKIIPEDHTERIKRSLLERVSLESICRIFNVSMPWLLDSMLKVFSNLPEDLNASIIVEDDEICIATLEADEM